MDEMAQAEQGNEWAWTYGDDATGHTRVRPFESSHEVGHETITEAPNQG